MNLRFSDVIMRPKMTKVMLVLSCDVSHFKQTAECIHYEDKCVLIG